MGASEIGENGNTGEKKWSQRIFVATFTLLLLIGVGLRFHGLTTQSYWLDELYSASVSQPESTPTEILQACARDAHPPLYEFLLWQTYRSFGYNELTGSALSAVFGVLGLLAIFLLGVTLWNRKAGLFTLAITSPLFFHVYYSQEVRSYSLLFLLTVLSWWTAILLLRKPSLLRTIVYAILSSALAYTHYFGIFVLVSQAVFVSGLLIWDWQRHWKVFACFFVSGVLVFVSYLPWLHPLLSNKLLRPQVTWIKPVSIWFPYHFVRDYFRSGFWVAVIASLFLFGLSRIRQGKQPEPTGSEKEISPYPLLWNWVLVTYYLPFLLSLVEAPMLIPRVTMVTLPAIILLIAGLARNIRTRNVIIASVLVALTLTGTLILGDHYYGRQWKEDWRSAVQYVIHSDPQAKSPVLAHWDYNFQAYFKMLGDNRKVIRPRRSTFLKLVTQTPVSLGFWVLKAHAMHEIDLRVLAFLGRYFKPVSDVKFHQSECTYYHFKSVTAKAKLIGGVALPESGNLPLDQLNGRFRKVPDGSIRLCSNGSVESCPFIFPEGSYRVRILARGNRVKGETAQFELSIGQKVVITGFTKEQPTWHDGELKIKNADVLPVTISFLNDYFERIEPDTPLNPGPVIKLKEGDWNGTLTRIGETENYSAKWVNEVDGTPLSDTIKIRKFTSANIVLYRKGLNGCYRGHMSPDGTYASGTADWYKGNGKWKAVFPDMKFSGTLDRNLDILQIKIISIPFRSEH